MRLRLQCWVLFFAVWLMVAAAPVVFGQGASTASSADAKDGYVPTLTFDVASIRQSPEADSYMVGGYFTPRTSNFRVTNWSYLNLVLAAYGLEGYQVDGLPRSRAMFNVEAKSDSAADEKMAKLSKEQEILEQQHMLQVLLADRFKLKTHWETREGLTYNLVLAKSGSKMHPSTGEPLSAEEAKHWGDRPVPAIYQKGDSRVSFDLVAHDCPMGELTEMLEGQFGRPVADKTGLAGKYNFTVRYHGSWLRDRRADDLDPVPTLDTAIQEQLGLKVEPTKGPVQVLVIDHIEAPSAN